MAITEEPRILEQAIEALTVAASRPARQRPKSITASVEAICEHAFTFGLETVPLERTVELVTTQNRLSQTIITNLIKNLYPAQHVRFEAVVRVIGALGLGGSKPSAITQNALIKWLIAICGVLEQKNHILRFYGVLFNLLDIISLRAPICRLLSIITSRKHVKPFRIQQLLEFLQSSDNDPTVAGLLLVYKDYCPKITVDDHGFRHTQFPNSSEREFKERLEMIQYSGFRAANSTKTECNNGVQVAQQNLKESGTSVLPYAHISDERGKIITLDMLHHANDIVAYFERLELPCQVATMLNNSLLPMLLIMHKNELFEKRLSAALEDLHRAVFTREIYWPDAKRFLDGLLQLVISTKDLMPCTLEFLRDFVPVWDGSECMDEILGLLSFLPPINFKRLHESILKPIELIVVSRVSDPTAVVLNLYTKLTSNWIVKILTGRSTEETVEAHLQADLKQLIHHVFSIIMSDQAAAENNHVAPQASAYIWRYASVNHKFRAVPMALPSPKILYNFLFSSALQDISSVCASLAIYKAAFEERHSLGFHYAKDIVDRFNSNLMNVCNVIWRSRAFLGHDASAHSRLCPESLAKELQAYLAQLDIDYSLSFLFGLSHNPTLTALSAASIRALEELVDRSEEPLTVRHEGPVTQRSLAKLTDEGGLEISWHDCRIEYLKYLESHGVTGIKNLMYVTIKDLMRTRK